MSKSLILLIAIFSLWAFISFSKNNQPKDNKKNDFNIADDDVKRTNYNGKVIINEVYV